MKRASITLAALGLFAVGCDAPSPTTPAVGTLLASSQGLGPVGHRVSVGSADVGFIPPGTDANFSLIAIQRADGSVTGQWEDSFGRDFAEGNTGGAVAVHVAVDCVKVVGNQAWISGVATDPTFAGQPVITRVSDNGTSANDPPDQISFSFIGFAISCNAMPNLPLFAIDHGQVTVD